MFSPQTLDFLATNHFMNSREYYAEHKPEFKQYVLRPLVETVETLAPVMERIDPYIVTEPKVDKTISRIYRDMRRAKGSFYREYMWLTFKRDKREFPGYPEFFFILSPAYFGYGCGHYGASNETMQMLRQMIAGDDPLFRKADAAYRRQKVFSLDGDLYKRSRYPDYPAEKRNWLDRKTVTMLYESRDFAELFSQSLAQDMAEAFQKISPVYELMLAAEQRANELRID